MKTKRIGWREAVGELLEKLESCNEAKRDFAESKARTPAAYWNAMTNPHDMVWIAVRVGVDPKIIALFACSFARTCLCYAAEGEDCMRIAIETSERFLAGTATREELESARSAAESAAFAVNVHMCDIIRQHLPEKLMVRLVRKLLQERT